VPRLEQANGRVEPVVVGVVDALFDRHVAVDHQPALEIAHLALIPAELEAEPSLGRQVPRAARGDECLVVLDGKLQVIGGVEREDRLDRVDEALGRLGIALTVRLPDHAAIAHLLPERQVFRFLSAQERGEGRGQTEAGRGGKQLTPR
jgi:hypothetical protein